MGLQGWEEYHLGDLVRSVSDTYKFQRDKIIFLNTGDVLEGKVLHRNYSEVSNLPGQAKKKIQKNDILFSEIRPANKRYALVDFNAHDYVVSTKLMVLRANEKIYVKFLLYTLANKKRLEYLQAVAENRSGTFPQITFNDIKSIKILLPPLDEQSRIASFLSSLDDKIELNLRMNKTLESIAQTIFKEWFVDFRFPGFDGVLVDGLPKGWERGKLGDVTINYDNKRVPLSSMERAKRKGKYPYYGAASIIDYVDNYLFDGTYLLIGEDGTVITDDGFPILQYVWGKFWVNNHAHVLQGKGEISTEFLYLFLKCTPVNSIVTGAVQPKINQANLNGIALIIPQKDILYQFSNLMLPIFNKLKNISEENQTITQLRDSLLPKLMSGKIRVP